MGAAWDVLGLLRGGAVTLRVQDAPLPGHSVHDVKREGATQYDLHHFKARVGTVLKEEKKNVLIVY